VYRKVQGPFPAAEQHTVAAVRAVQRLRQMCPGPGKFTALGTRRADAVVSLFAKTRPQQKKHPVSRL
jgi:hypothetical protein